MITITTWKSDLVFESRQDEIGSVLMDGNRETAMSPKALLLSGLAGCSGIDVVEILKKMRVEFSDLEITCEAEQTEESPKVFKEIQLIFSVKVDPADTDKVKKAIDLSMEKYCGVAAMLRKNSAINYKLNLL
jgi:putative redox protein